MRKVTVAQGAISNIVLTGLNAQDRNITTIYDTSNGVETELNRPRQRDRGLPPR